MKNIHVLPTAQPSRLFKFANELHLDTIPKDYYKKYNIYITSDEDIKEDDWGLSKLNEVILFGRSYNEKFYKKIILTTDQDLIADGVQAIDDEFLEWFIKNPTCEFVEVQKWTNYSEVKYKLIIPQEEPKQETLEEFIESQPYYGTCTTEYKEGIEEGAKWQSQRMYSEEDLEKAFKHGILFKEESVSTCEEAIETEFSMLVEQLKKK
jgi:hypothetical protein